MKKWLRDQIIFPLVSKLPRNLCSRIKMAGTCLFGQGWGYLVLSIPTGDIHDVSADEIQKLYGELSNRSREVLLTYHKYASYLASLNQQNGVHHYYFYQTKRFHLNYYKNQCLKLILFRYLKK